MRQKRNLIYTIAFDKPGEVYLHAMAALLARSILKMGFRGDVMIFRNSRQRVIDPPHSQVTEMKVRFSSEAEFVLDAQQSKYRLRRFIKAEEYDKVMFVDCDCLFLKDPERLFNAPVDVMFAQEPFNTITCAGNNAYLTDEEMRVWRAPAINSGLLWVRGTFYQELFDEWERVDSQPPLRFKVSGDQQAWVRVVRNCRLKTRPFQFDLDVRYPCIERRTSHEFSKATVLHFAAAPPQVKAAFMLGMYLQWFEPTKAPTLLPWLDILRTPNREGLLLGQECASD